MLLYNYRHRIPSEQMTRLIALKEWSYLFLENQENPGNPKIDEISVEIIQHFFLAPTWNPKSCPVKWMCEPRKMKRIITQSQGRGSLQLEQQAWKCHHSPATHTVTAKTGSIMRTSINSNLNEWSRVDRLFHPWRNKVLEIVRSPTGVWILPSHFNRKSNSIWTELSA